jgi:hypothetical protein
MNKKAVLATSEFGVVVRREALSSLKTTEAQLFFAMESNNPIGESDQILSFGPHFGEEAAKEFSKRLESIGLSYYDDFFVFFGDYPEWCGFAVFGKDTK